MKQNDGWNQYAARLMAVEAVTRDHGLTRESLESLKHEELAWLENVLITMSASGDLISTLCGTIVKGINTSAIMMLGYRVTRDKRPMEQLDMRSELRPLAQMLREQSLKHESNVRPQVSQRREQRVENETKQAPRKKNWFDKLYEGCSLQERQLIDGANFVRNNVSQVIALAHNKQPETWARHDRLVVDRVSMAIDELLDGFNDYLRLIKYDTHEPGSEPPTQEGDGKS